jgi:T-complex protein 1 subunit delta
MGVRNVKIVKVLGGTVDESDVIEGIVLTQKVNRRVDFTPRRVTGARICLAQFHISVPRADMDSSVVLSNCTQVDRLLEEGRHYVIRFVKVMKSFGVNVLLLQKSLLRDTLSDVAEYYMSRAGILTVRGVERDDVVYISRAVRKPPAVQVELVREDLISDADLVEEFHIGQSCVTRIQGMDLYNGTSTVLIRGCNDIVLSESERALRDSFSVVRNLIRKSSLLYGGGSSEVQSARRLILLSKVENCTYSFCVRAFAESIEVLPFILAENAGMDPAKIVNVLRSRHGRGHRHDGVSIYRRGVGDMSLEGVVHPLLVLTSAISLAGECSGMIIKVDAVVQL